jgi:hypothetical protein
VDADHPQSFAHVDDRGEFLGRLALVVHALHGVTSGRYLSGHHVRQLAQELLHVRRLEVGHQRLHARPFLEEQQAVRIR